MVRRQSRRKNVDWFQKSESKGSFYAAVRFHDLKVGLKNNADYIWLNWEVSGGSQPLAPPALSLLEKIFGQRRVDSIADKNTWKANVVFYSCQEHYKTRILGRQTGRS